MTEEELEQRISNMIDNRYPEMAERFENESITRRIRQTILDIEIESIQKAVEKVENISGLH